MSTADTQSTILSNLNDAQRRAVTSTASTVAILAGPGSGKTHTLTSRVVWLIQQEGYQPADVIVATFTVKAAREMRERIGKALGDDVQKRIILGTFHSIARRYLAAYGRHIGLDSNFSIADDTDSRAIIQRICKRLNLTIEPSHAKSWISKKKAKGTLATLPHPQKKQPENPSLLTCYNEYQDHLRRSNLLDYDDLLVRCVELLREHPACVFNVQVVLIDEYQDTNGIQYELMRLFAQQRQRITIVGDPDQSIYGWRSAEIRNLYRLLRDFPSTDEVSLEENYRSSQWILDVSLNVIQQDKNRYQKVLLPVHHKGTKPVLRRLKSSAAEGEWIVSEIKRILMLFGKMLKGADIAILIRSAYLSRHVESALGKAGITYRMIGGHKFYERKEIKILLDYLRVVSQPDNNDVVARIVNVPRRGIGETTIKSLLDEAERAKLSLWTLLCKHCRGERTATTKIRRQVEQSLNVGLMRVILALRTKLQDESGIGKPLLVQLIELLLSHLGFNTYLEEEYPDDHEQRWANVQEFLNLASDFVRDFGAEDDALPEIEDLPQRKQDDILTRFLANVSLASDAQINDSDGDQTSVVTISTIHAAKGLEWPVVFVPSVYDGSIPHARAEDSDEERRLLYVAMTRAQTLLYLSCPIYGSQGTSAQVDLSPFIAPFASKAFDTKGPSFDRPVIEGVAKLLGREAPSDVAVFEKMPPMCSIEDDLFPIDPLEARKSEASNGAYDGHHSRAHKRQWSSYSDEEDEEPRERTWKRTESTVSDARSATSNIMPMPGFVTAGAHQTTLDAAAAAAAFAEESAKFTKNAPRKGSTARGSGQRSLLGFLKHQPAAGKSVGLVDRHDPSSTSNQRKVAAVRALPRAAAAVESEKVAMDPSLMNHRLGRGRGMPGPCLETSSGGGVVPKKRYTCFSSSPPKPASPEKPCMRHNNEPDAAHSRPVASFHRTTFASAQSKGVARRPLGLGVRPSMNQTRKPFKPLTINKQAD